ncbi:unnamed protein product [Rhizopus stolonifer]
MTFKLNDFVLSGSFQRMINFSSNMDKLKKRISLNTITQKFLLRLGPMSPSSFEDESRKTSNLLFISTNRGVRDQFARNPGLPSLSSNSQADDSGKE